MDIWAWVHDLSRDLRAAGHGRAAELIWRIPDEMYQMARVTAALPEAVAAARSLNNPWLEVYFRHWGLQSRAWGTKDGETALGETVALFEFAHRPETMDCPQSVCVTQDLTLCYANIDAPGTAAARLEVLRETLDRITPEWPCYTCLTVEYGTALVDDGRPEEALGFLTGQSAALGAVGEKIRWDIPFTAAQALRDLGRFDEALTSLDQADRTEGESSTKKYQQDRNILRAGILARRGRLEEAADLLPDFDALMPHSRPPWSAVAADLATAEPARNTWHLAAQLQTCLDHAVKTGAHHDAVQIGLRQASLALARGVRWIAAEALDIVATHLTKLKKPESPAQAAAALRRQTESLTADAAPMPVPPEALVDWLRAHDEIAPERAITWLREACAALPLDATLVEAHAGALRSCGRTDAALEVLRAFVCANPAIDGPNFALLGGLLELGRTSEVEALAHTIEAENPSAALWFRAKLAGQRDDWQETARHCAALLEERPGAAGVLSLWAEAAARLGDWPSVLRLRRELCALQADNNAARWNLVTAASAAEDWPSVRDAAGALDMSFDTESGVIEENWGRAYIRFDDGDEAKTYYAIRTGPATARILSPAVPPAAQHIGDWIAFDASLLEPRPESEEERARFVPTFRAVHIIQPGGFGESCFIDGAKPADEVFEAFLQAVDGLGWRYWITSGEDYQVTDPETGTAIPGCYFWITAPSMLSPREVDQRLRDLTSGWQHPACWGRYAERAGLPTERHAAIAERYGL